MTSKVTIFLLFNQYFNEWENIKHMLELGKQKLSLISLGYIHLRLIYFVCSSLPSMFSKTKNARTQTVLC